MNRVPCLQLSGDLLLIQTTSFNLMGGVNQKKRKRIIQKFNIGEQIDTKSPCRVDLSFCLADGDLRYKTVACLLQGTRSPEAVLPVFNRLFCDPQLLIQSQQLIIDGCYIGFQLRFYSFVSCSCLEIGGLKCSFLASYFTPYVRLPCDSSAQIVLSCIHPPLSTILRRLLGSCLSSRIERWVVPRLTLPVVSPGRFDLLQGDPNIYGVGQAAFNISGQVRIFKALLPRYLGYRQTILRKLIRSVKTFIQYIRPYILFCGKARLQSKKHDRQKGQFNEFKLINDP